MNCFKIISLALFCVLCIDIQAQPTRPTKINELFIEYLTQKLDLTPGNIAQMRPLVKSYLIERKKIVNNYPDPLEREEQVVALKIKYRKQFSNIIGLEKANLFFTHEQLFRRKVKEELRKRKKALDPD